MKLKLKEVVRLVNPTVVRFNNRSNHANWLGRIDTSQENDWLPSNTRVEGVRLQPRCPVGCGKPRSGWRCFSDTFHVPVIVTLEVAQNADSSTFDTLGKCSTCKHHSSMIIQNTTSRTLDVFVAHALLPQQASPAADIVRISPLQPFVLRIPTLPHVGEIHHLSTVPRTERRKPKLSPLKRKNKVRKARRAPKQSSGEQTHTSERLHSARTRHGINVRDAMTNSASLILHQIVSTLISFETESAWFQRTRGVPSGKKKPHTWIDWLLFAVGSCVKDCMHDPFRVHILRRITLRILPGFHLEVFSVEVWGHNLRILPRFHLEVFSVDVWGSNDSYEGCISIWEYITHYIHTIARLIERFYKIVRWYQ
jgi:hypothetical protein